MAAGQPPPNPSELLASPAMATLLKTLLASYDMVLLDSPALLPMSDAALLSNIAGGALVVVGADRLQQPQLREALEYLQTAGAHVYGIIMNKLNHIEAGTLLDESSYAPKPRGESRHSHR
jgi:Mrp family chromosome partitioning ATPase